MPMDSKGDTLTRRGLFGRLFVALVAAVGVAASIRPALTVSQKWERWYQRHLDAPLVQPQAFTVDFSWTAPATFPLGARARRRHKRLTRT